MLPHGVYAIVDGSAGRPPLELVGAFVRGGAAVVQLRLKDAGAGEFLRVAREARKLTAGKALLLINDRPDVAKLAEADGVHLGQDDLPVAAAWTGSWVKTRLPSASNPNWVTRGSSSGRSPSAARPK